MTPPGQGEPSQGDTCDAISVQSSRSHPRQPQEKPGPVSLPQHLYNRRAVNLSPKEAGYEERKQLIMASNLQKLPVRGHGAETLTQEL